MSFLLNKKGNLDIFNRFQFSGILCGVVSTFGCQRNIAIRQIYSEFHSLKVLKSAIPLDGCIYACVLLN